MPTALAVLTLITKSYRVGCSMGSSPGLAPLRILSTYVAPRLAISNGLALNEASPPSAVISRKP